MNTYSRGAHDVTREPVTSPKEWGSMGGIPPRLHTYHHHHLQKPRAEPISLNTSVAVIPSTISLSLLRSTACVEARPSIRRPVTIRTLIIVISRMDKHWYLLAMSYSAVINMPWMNEAVPFGKAWRTETMAKRKESSCLLFLLLHSHEEKISRFFGEFVVLAPLLGQEESKQCSHNIHNQLVLARWVYYIFSQSQASPVSRR